MGDLSFFSFQDIITCVTGILLLVTLVMAAQISNRPARAESTPAATSMIAGAEAAELGRASVERTAAADAIVQRQDMETARLRRGLGAVTLIAAATSGKADEVRGLAEQVPALAAAAAPRLNAARAEVAKLDAELADHQAQLRDAERAAAAAIAAAKAAPELAFLPGDQKSRPMLVELRATSTRIGDLDAKGRPRLLASADDLGSATAAIDRALAQLRLAGDPVTVVILAHPDGVDRVGEVTEAIRGRGLSVGWDVAPGRAVFDPNGGGGDGATTRP